MNYSLSAMPRTTERVQDVRAASRIPAVIYGKGIPSRSLSLAKSEFIRLARAAGTSSLVDVAVEGEAPVKALIKEIQRHIISLDPIHVDFYQVRMDVAITATVSLVLVGESVAIKLGGGTLVTSLDHIEVECLPGDLPHEIQVDISVLVSFDNAITVSSLNLPKGVTAKTDGGIVIATVAAPLTEEQLKKMEEGATVDLTAIKTVSEEKRAAEEAKKAEEEAAAK